MTKVEKSIEFMGPEYIRNLVKCLIDDQSFFMSVLGSLDPNIFPSEYRRIVGFMVELHSKSNVVTYTTLEEMIRFYVTDPISVEQFLARVQELKDLDLSQDMATFTKKLADPFFQQQSIIKAINQMKDIVEKGEYSKYSTIPTIVENAMKVGVKRKTSHTVAFDLDKTLSEDARNTIPIGLDEVDKSLQGGLGKGELGVIIAPSGIGKTSFCVGVGAHAAYMGFKVLHYYFEDAETEIRRKYIANCLWEKEPCIEASTMSDELIAGWAKDALKDNPMFNLLTDNVRLQRLDNSDVSVSDIEAMIKAEIADGFTPDLFILDYFDCLKMGGGRQDNYWQMEATTMRRLESLCNKFNIAIWTPIQSTKGVMKKGAIALNEGGGSVQKVQVAHTVLTIGATDDMKPFGVINLKIEKFREGKTLKTDFKSIRFNHGSCRFLPEMDFELNAMVAKNTHQKANLEDAILNLLQDGEALRQIDIIERLNGFERTKIQRAVKRMLEVGVIVRSDNLYRLSQP